jgi:hypothetical protein
MPDNYKFFGNDKYMWDGSEYDSKEAAEEAEKKLKEENFETKVIEEDGKFFLYNRRQVKEVVVEGAPM